MTSARDLLRKWPKKAKEFNAARSFTETLNKPVNSTRIIHPEPSSVARSKDPIEERCVCIQTSSQNSQKSA